MHSHFKMHPSSIHPTSPTTGPWLPTLKLRFLHHAHAHAPTRTHGGRPRALIPLFEGGVFDPQYNADRPACAVPIPHWTRRAEVVAVITGMALVLLYFVFCRNTGEHFCFL